MCGDAVRQQRPVVRDRVSLAAGQPGVARQVTVQQTGQQPQAAALQPQQLVQLQQQAVKAAVPPASLLVPPECSTRSEPTARHGRHTTVGHLGHVLRRLVGLDCPHADRAPSERRAVPVADDELGRHELHLLAAAPQRPARYDVTKLVDSSEGPGFNQFDPVLTATRGLSRRFGLAGGFAIFGILLVVEGDEIIKALGTQELAIAIEDNVATMDIVGAHLIAIEEAVVLVTEISGLMRHGDLLGQAGTQGVGTSNDHTVVDAQLEEGVTHCINLGQEVRMGHSDLTVLVATLFLVRDLIFDLYATSTSLDHFLRQQISGFFVTKTGIDIGNDWHDKSVVCGLLASSIMLIITIFVPKVNFDYRYIV